MTDYRNNRAIVYFPLLTFILYCHCDKYKAPNSIPSISLFFAHLVDIKYNLLKLS